MHAAVVRSFDRPPRYEMVPTPAPAGDELLVDVLAAGLHPRVRSDASGSHYTSDGVLPLVPGLDAVGRTAAGELVYFVATDGGPGTMADRATVDPRRMVPLPSAADPVMVAAAMNPAMSSWLALRRRVDFRPGSSVLVLGATGNAGGIAVEIAKHLGAAHVIAAGRNAERLAALRGRGADATVPLQDGPESLAELAANVDIVLDYLWGPVAERAIPALVHARADRSRPLDWVQIAAVAGPDIALPSAALRAADVRVVGSGQGSIRTAAILAELPALAELIVEGALRVDPLPVPLRDVEAAWGAPAGPGQRVVLVPDASRTPRCTGSSPGTSCR